MPRDELLHRIRWGNVVRVAVVVGSVALVLAWPRLAPRVPEPPPSALLPARPAVPAAAPPPGEALGPPAPAVSDPDSQTAMPRPSRRITPRRATAAREGRSGGSAPVSARSRRAARQRPTPAPKTAASPPRRAAPAPRPRPARPAPHRQVQREFGPAASEFPAPR